jgi:integrase
MMPRKKKLIPEYATCMRNGNLYYRTRIVDSDGKRVALYAKTAEELYDKVIEAERLIADASFRKATPTVNEYTEKWLLMQKGRLRTTTLTDYEWKVKKFIQKPLGKKFMAEVTPDDVKIALLPALGMSESVYRCTQMLYKLIFTSAVDSNVIKVSPCDKIPAKGGKTQKVKQALTDEQVKTLLSAIKGLPPYVFVMVGLYCGLRREEILALKWDSVFLDEPSPYLTVRRAWHTEHNRPVILDDLKTKAARRDIPIPAQLVECLKEAKAKSTSDYVIANSDGGPLSYTQFQRVWKYIVTRSTKERTYVRYVNGQKIKHTVTPVLGEKASHNGNVVYSMDFQVTPHQLRHTYITNLIYAGVDPKTVQYLAGHENSKITMDIYAKVKYNNPEALSSVVNSALEKVYTAV